MNPPLQQNLIRGILAFVLILVLFVCIEILPLYVGPKHLPFDLLWKEFTDRLPRMLLIALAAAIFLGIGKQPLKKTDKS
nr:hypothetical protein [uncultured Gammaproteobacteria bacterium]